MKVRARAAMKMGMGSAWLVGWIAPLLMLAFALAATANRHRWRTALWIGTIAGGGFCAAACTALHAAIGRADRTLEIAFLQVALSSAGLLIFGVVTMLAWKWQKK